MCPCDGLIVVSGVSLEIGGTITGENDACSGILIEGNATSVAVTNGRITGFGLGVDGDSLGAASGNRFANLQIREGISLSGADNAAELNRANYNGRAEFVVEGMGLTVRRNIGTSNALDGFEVDASASTFDRNRRDSNGLLGIADTGTDNNYVDNRCTGNDLGPSNPPDLCR